MRMKHVTWSNHNSCRTVVCCSQKIAENVAALIKLEGE